MNRRLLVAMLPESGHLNPSYKLMRTLSRRGHDVRYLSAPELIPAIEAQGFGAIPLFAELHARFSEREEGRFGLLRKRRAITARFQAVAKRLAELGAHAFGPPPALALVDVTQTHLALWARASGIPLVLLNTSLPQIESPGVPPLRSGMAFSADSLGRLKSRLAWDGFVAKRRLSASLAGTLGLAPPYALASELAPQFGIDAAELDSRTVYMPQLKGHHELVFSPRELDFPRPEDPLRHHVESVDLGRSESALSWEHLDDEKPLVYCALGGQLYRAADTPAFLRRVVKVFAAHPEWNLVLATGRHMRPDALLPLPPNVIAVERAPQLAVLARARAMITHGGLGSIKECLLHGVPMLVFPLAVDQPGNAARVVHHGLGLVGDVRRSREGELCAMLMRILNEPSFGEHARTFRGVLERLERSERGADLVESFLERPELLLAHAPARRSSLIQPVS